MRGETLPETSDLFDEAVSSLRAGNVVVIPTDTVYGLAVDPTRTGAVDGLFRLKRRPSSLTLPVLVGGFPDALALAAEGSFDGVAGALARELWPGALTIVVERSRSLRWDLGGDGRSIGLRCPDHPIARGLCQSVGPLATTSANLHGERPVTDPEQLRRMFGEEVVVLDGGNLNGEASTVVDARWRELACLRRGAVPWEEILRISGEAGG